MTNRQILKHLRDIGALAQKTAGRVMVEEYEFGDGTQFEILTHGTGCPIIVLEPITART